MCQQVGLGRLALPSLPRAARVLVNAIRRIASMKRLCVVVLLSLFAVAPAVAQEGAACAAKAVGKDGKPLAGAAKDSSMKKCCDASAVGKEGKKLAGAVKTSFMKKCESGT